MHECQAAIKQQVVRIGQAPHSSRKHNNNKIVWGVIMRLLGIPGWIPARTGRDNIYTAASAAGK